MKAFWVGKRLAFGSAITTWGHVEQLQELGITHVVNLRSNRHGKKIRQFKNLWLSFRDDMKPRPKWFYRDASHFYGKAMRRPNTKVFVMCHHGICRSASMTYFLLRLSGKSASRSETLIRNARSCARIVPAYRESGERFLEHYQRHGK